MSLIYNLPGDIELRLEKIDHWYPWYIIFCGYIDPWYPRYIIYPDTQNSCSLISSSLIYTWKRNFFRYLKKPLNYDAILISSTRNLILSRLCILDPWSSVSSVLQKSFLKLFKFYLYIQQSDQISIVFKTILKQSLIYNTIDCTQSNLSQFMLLEKINA